MITIEELKEQLNTKQFRNMLFTAYNVIVDDGFVAEASNFLKRNCDMDDFEFVKFDISEDDKKAIKRNDEEIINTINEFKTYVERELQKGFSACRVYTLKDVGSVIAVRLKKH